MSERSSLWQFRPLTIRIQAHEEVRVRDLDVHPEPNRPTGGGDIPPPFYGVDLNRETAIRVLVEALEWYASLDLVPETTGRAEQALGIWRSGGYDRG